MLFTRKSSSRGERTIIATGRCIVWVAGAIGALCFLAGCSPLSPPEPGDASISAIRLIMGRERYDDLQKTGHLRRWQSTRVRDGDTSIAARIRIHGQFSRNEIKKSYKLQLYRVQREEAESTIVLSPQFGDPSFCRYRLAHFFFEKAGLLVPGIEPVRLFIDGKYEGLYLRIEDVDEKFLRRRGLALTSLYKINGHGRFNSALGMLPMQSFEKHIPQGHRNYHDLERLIALVDQGLSRENAERLESLLDVQNVLDYYAVCRLISHTDGITNNFYLYLHPASKRFVMIPWDFDMTFKHIHENFPRYANGLFEQLEHIPAYREYLRRRTVELFNYAEAQRALDSMFYRTRATHILDPYGAFRAGRGDTAYQSIRVFLSHIDTLVASHAGQRR